jgi:hypothetical protein
MSQQDLGNFGIAPNGCDVQRSVSVATDARSNGRLVLLRKRLDEVSPPGNCRDQDVRNNRTASDQIVDSSAVLINTTVSGNPNPPFDPAAAQAWVTVVMDAAGRFSVGFSAIQLDSACAPNHFVP